MELKNGYKQTEVGVIPSDWEVLQLGDLFDFKNGLNKEKKFFGLGTPIVNYMDVYKYRGLTAKDLAGKVTLSKQELDNYSAKKGDVFFTRTSETVDEIGLTSVILDDVADTVFSGFLLRARPKSNTLENNYKKYCFSPRSVRKQITSKSSYTTRALTNGRLLSQVKISVPQKSEQTAIATALSDADALITGLEKLIAKKRNIKQGAMQELLKPKKGWEEKTYGEVFDFLTTANYSRADINQGGTSKYIHYGDIHTKWDSFVDIGESDLPSVRDEQVSGYPFIKEGDIVMADASEDYAGVGKSVEVTNLNGARVISGLHTFLMRDRVGTFIHGFRGYIHSIKSVKYQFDRLATGLKVYGISKNNLRTVMIPVPPKEEQTIIERTLRDMGAEITQLEEKLKKLKNVKQGMMQNLLTGKIRLI